ncbi:MAG: TetR/AcrR family transcriptional regulator [Saprospiraceae bacterium]|nr:TetR/AcrR family transcriptional regulator [Saprospiraceae bacterium]
MPRKKQFDEDEVLEKAMQLFWLKGYHGTSIQNLVDYLGINRASLYDTFGGKHQLFLETLDRYKFSNADALLESFKEMDNVLDGLKSMFMILLQESLDDEEQKGCLMVNTTTELAPHDEVSTKVVQENRQKFIRFFKSLLEEAQERGELDADKDPEDTAQYLFTLYNGMKVIAKLEKDPQVMERMLETGLSVLD